MGPAARRHQLIITGGVVTTESGPFPLRGERYWPVRSSAQAERARWERAALRRGLLAGSHTWLIVRDIREATR